MKAIMMSIRPQYVAKILNGEKTIEIRKKFPSDYVGWVYIYVTKGNGLVLCNTYIKEGEYKKAFLKNWKDKEHPILNGKVVARFWCDKVEKIRSYLEPEQWYMTSDLGGSGLLHKSCLTFKELDDYLLSGDGKAIPITKLEIFDKPKEISEFIRYNAKSYPLSALPKTKEKYKEFSSADDFYKYVLRLTKAPQSFCFIEIE